MRLEQSVIVGGNGIEFRLERILFGFGGILEQTDIHEEQRAIGTHDGERTVG